jgi:hypothetical protein
VRLSPLLTLVLAVSFVGCDGAVGNGFETDELVLEDSLQGTVTVGAFADVLRDTTLHAEPRKRSTALAKVPAGSRVKHLAADPVNRYYNVEFNGQAGWINGGVLKLASTTGTTNTDPNTTSSLTLAPH